MNRDWNTAAIVHYGNPRVGQDRYLNVIAITRQRLVDRVVHDLVDQMVNSALIGAANVHAWASSYRLESFKDLNAVDAVTLTIDRHLLFLYQFKPG
jgi:hypothetical protein